jgi:hypothetical protein
MRNQGRGPDVDLEKCIAMAGGNRFDLIIQASELARKIKRANTHSDRHEHIHTPVTALLEIQHGKK